MAIYVADLSTVTGWTERWATTEGSFAANTSPTRLTITKTGESNEYGISLDAVDSDADRDKAEILAKVRFGVQTTATRMCGVFARGSGGSSTETGLICYLFDAGNDGNDFRPSIIKTVSGTASLVANVSASNVAGTWYWFRFRVNGTSIKARSWADGEQEPSAWDVDTTDSSVTAAGWVGFYGFDTIADPYDLGYFAVGTNGDSPGGGSSRVQFIGV